MGTPDKEPKRSIRRKRSNGEGVRMLAAKTFATEHGDIKYWVSEAPDPALPWLVFLPGLTADHRLFKDQLAYFDGEATKSGKAGEADDMSEGSNIGETGKSDEATNGAAPAANAEPAPETASPWTNCLVWDPPAHGESRPFPLTFTMDDMATWLHSILEREGVQRPVLVGQSMGGYVSQAFMDLFPGQAGGFISLDSAPLQRQYYPNWEVAFLRHTKSMYLAIPWGLLKAWGSVGVAQTPEGRSLMRAFMDSYEREEYCALAGHGFKILADALDARRPYQIDCPALLVCGRKDYAGDVRAFNRKWTRSSGIPLRWIEDAGHNVNTDKPEEINQTIQDFLKEHL